MRIRLGLLMISNAAALAAHPLPRASSAPRQLGYETNFDLVTVTPPVDAAPSVTGRRFLPPPVSDITLRSDRRSTSVRIHGRQVRLSIPIG